jgi:hypothetical protein
MKTFVSFLLRAIAKEDTLLRMKFKFVLIVRASVRPTSTTKDFKKSVVRRFIEQLFDGSLHFEETCRHAINEKTSCKESITPKPERNICMSKKSKPSFYNMTVLAFSSSVLLMSMRTCDTMDDAKLMKEGIEIAISAP